MNLKEIANAMFSKRSEWVNISDEDKELSFFIFNRYFSKKYPEKAQLFNTKVIDKVTCLNLWFEFMKGKPYPNYFWDKFEKKKSEGMSCTKLEYNHLLKNLNIKDIDLDYLIENHSDFIKEEIKNYKEIQKNK